MVLRRMLLCAVVALAVGSSTAHADDPYRLRGRAIVTVTPTDLDGARDPLRYEVDALFSAEASPHSNGLLCRFELTDVVDRRRGVFVLDVDLDAMTDARAVELPSRSVSLRYHELAPGALLAFDGQIVSGTVELLALSYTSSPGVSVHLRFNAELADTASGETRLFESGELVAVDSVLPPNADPWLYDEAPDVIVVTDDYDLTDCSGDPYSDPYYEDESWDNGEGYDYGGNTVSGSGGGSGGGYDSGDNTGDNTGGGYDYGDNTGDNTGGGYDYVDGQNVDTGSSWSNNDWSSDRSGDYDSSGGCGGDSGDDGLDCGGGDDVSGSEGCGGGGGGGGDALACVHATKHTARSTRRGARWRGWNLFPLVPFLMWWAWLKRRTVDGGEERAT